MQTHISTKTVFVYYFLDFLFGKCNLDDIPLEIFNRFVLNRFYFLSFSILTFYLLTSYSLSQGWLSPSPGRGLCQLHLVRIYAPPPKVVTPGGRDRFDWLSYKLHYLIVLPFSKSIFEQIIIEPFIL